MITVGALTLPAALILVVAGMCGGDCPGASQPERDSAASARTALPFVFFGGIVTTAVGIALLVSGGAKFDLEYSEETRTPRMHIAHGLELTPRGFVF